MDMIFSEQAVSKLQWGKVSSLQTGLSVLQGILQMTPTIVPRGHCGQLHQGSAAPTSLAAGYGDPCRLEPGFFCSIPGRTEGAVHTREGSGI